MQSVSQENSALHGKLEGKVNKMCMEVLAERVGSGDLKGFLLDLRSELHFYYELLKPLASIMTGEV